MTTNANAPVETRHKDEARTAWNRPIDMEDYLARCAQTLANLEAANNRLAEIDRIAKRRTWESGGVDFKRVAALASGHTPSPCPSCAAKDEAMEAFKADVSEAICRMVAASHRQERELIAKPFIPPADPVAEALKAVLDTYLLGIGDGPRSAAEAAALAELKSRLPLGGAK